MLRRLIDFFWGPSDPRTYALVRGAIALAGLVNLIDLWSHRYQYFASTGMIAKDAIDRTTRGGWYFSVFEWIGSQTGVTLVFLGAAAALLALGLGLCTRASAALVFAWHLSYSHRAFPILHSWDAILRVYSLFVLISPTGRVWSLDHVIRPHPPIETTCRFTGSVSCNGSSSSSTSRRSGSRCPTSSGGTASCAPTSACRSTRATPNDLFFVRHEWLSALETYLSLAIESSVPWLLAFRRTRVAGLVAGGALHLGIAVTSTLGVFSVSMIGPYFAFLERHDIDRLLARRTR